MKGNRLNLQAFGQLSALRCHPTPVNTHAEGKKKYKNNNISFGFMATIVIFHFHFLPNTFQSQTVKHPPKKTQSSVSNKNIVGVDFKCRNSNTDLHRLGLTLRNSPSQVTSQNRVRRFLPVPIGLHTGEGQTAGNSSPLKLCSCVRRRGVNPRNGGDM